MRKVFALLLVAGVFAFASCGKKTSETTTTDTTHVETAPAPAAADTAMKADTAAHATDTSAHTK